MYEEKIPLKRLGTVEEGYGQERQAAGKQIQILRLQLLIAHPTARA